MAVTAPSSNNSRRMLIWFEPSNKGGSLRMRQQPPASHPGTRPRILGHVTVGAFPTAVAGITPATLNALQRERPDTTLSLIEATTPALIDHIQAHDLDVAVVTAAPEGQRTSTRPDLHPACSTRIWWRRSDKTTDTLADTPSSSATSSVTPSSPVPTPTRTHCFVHTVSKTSAHGPRPWSQTGSVSSPASPQASALH